MSCAIEREKESGYERKKELTKRGAKRDFLERYKARY